MGTMIDEPFGPALSSIHLRESPLEFVVAQIRFPLVVSIGEEQFIGPFQELIRQEYSDLRRETETRVEVGPEGVRAAKGGVVWRFTSETNDWEVALTPEFLALATKNYTHREDFLTRLETLVDGLGDWLDLKKTRRVGVRYIDRVTGNHLDDLPDLVRPEVLGVAGTPLPDAVTLHHALDDCEYRFADDTALRARWGCLEPKTTFDPAIDPIDDRSWVLDIDASHGERSFEAAAVRDQVQLFSDRIYRYFRWAVTDDFLTEFGAET
ncbi:MAG: hypothetical protein JJLCMIEE_02977 [Acidimicrobiales bacterium]|nr:hypothetical protein [Acidimicrobiales bacterium]